ncbi:hypothetical protein ACFE04_019852 [Oxalis oulophora]
MSGLQEVTGLLSEKDRPPFRGRQIRYEINASALILIIENLAIEEHAMAACNRSLKVVTDFWTTPGLNKAKKTENEVFFSTKRSLNIRWKRKYKKPAKNSPLN